MESNFDYFATTIPPEVYSRAKAYICNHIAIFEPEDYAAGEVICVDDYHFILFFSNAPVTKVNNVEYCLKKGDMLVVQPWEEIYAVPCGTQNFGKYLHIAVKKDFFKKIAVEIAGGDAFRFKKIKSLNSFWI